MRWWRTLAAVLLSAGGPAVAQDRVVTSPAPDRVALTVYRAPQGAGPIDLADLNGFALVTETRRIRVPRGPAVLRFEGVATGIVAVSAVVDGLPGGVVEKNRDARLLSPASLVDGTLGRQVTLTRTDRATGRRISEEATIVAGFGRGVVLRTTTGVEALRCSGLPERLAFDGVPAGLSARAVLSVATVSPAARTVTVRLSYLAGGFDWRASYVATQAQDGRTVDLFAWLTLANGNPEGFDRAEVNAVAGRLNRVATRPIPQGAGELRLPCYPLGTTTSDLREEVFEPADEIVVTASRMVSMMAPPPPPPPAPPPPPPPPPPPENLGDLKLYRVPERVAVRARGQKQVALLVRAAVPFERRYRRAVWPGMVLDAGPTAITLVMRNTPERGLGLPLPSGSTALYAARPGGERLLLGLGTLDDRAEGQTVRIAAGISHQVSVTQVATTPKLSSVTVTNGNPFAVTVDVPIGAPGQAIASDGAGETLVQVDGIMTWSPTLPPGGTANLRYRLD